MHVCSWKYTLCGDFCWILLHRSTRTQVVLQRQSQLGTNKTASPPPSFFVCVVVVVVFVAATSISSYKRAALMLQLASVAASLLEMGQYCRCNWSLFCRRKTLSSLQLQKKKETVLSLQPKFTLSSRNSFQSAAAKVKLSLRKARL